MTYAIKVRPAGATAWFYAVRWGERLHTANFWSFTMTTKRSRASTFTAEEAEQVVAGLERDAPGVSARVVSIA